MMTVHSNHAIVFDTETTGLIENSAIPLKSQPSVIELCALRIDLELVKSHMEDGEGLTTERIARIVEKAPMWSSLFHHGTLPEETTGITGITQEMVNLAPSFASMLPSLTEFVLGSRWLVGHNLSYDRDMLAIELRRLDALTKFPWPPKHICTVERTETIEGFRLGLNDLHERLTGMRFSEHHRAEPDTRATARNFLALINLGKIKL